MSLTPIFSAEEFFTRLVDDIRSAQDSVRLETYIFAFDAIGERIVKALTETASRGVRVQVLVDGFGAPQWGGQLVAELEREGGLTRIYHPMPWNFWQWGHATNRTFFVTKLLHLWTNLNKRNHRKTCVIDDKTVWIGSFNITQDHLPVKKGGRGFQDAAVRIENPSEAEEVAHAFGASWEHSKDLEGRRPTHPRIRLNTTFRMRNRARRSLYLKMKECRERLWIANAYFIPSLKLQHILTRTVAHGVDTRIIIPGVSDVPLLRFATEMFLKKLLAKGVRIFRLNEGILHAKSMILDNYGLLGSSNLNSRSFIHDLEIDYLSSNPLLVAPLVEQYHQYLEHSTEVTADELTQLSWWDRLRGNITLWVVNWL